MNYSLIFPLLLSSASPVVETFAIECVGQSLSTTLDDGQIYRDQNALPQQIFVFNESEQRADRALKPRRQFDPICLSENNQRNLDFSPGMIQISFTPYFTDVSKWECSFSVNRFSGEATYNLKSTYQDGDYYDLVWKMDCKPTPIPVFDVKERKF